MYTIIARATVIVIESQGEVVIKLAIIQDIEQAIIAISHIGNKAFNCTIPDKLPILPL